MDKKDDIELSVVIPFYNEENNVRPVVEELRSTLENARIPFEILCVSNGSTDNTERAITQITSSDKRVRGIYLQEKGYGLAINTGFQHAQKELVAFMSGDGQIDAHDIVAGYKKILDTGADIIKPRRIKREDGLFRAIQSFVYNTLLKTLFGLPLWDFNCPAKMIRRDFLKRLNIQSKDWFIDPEMIIKIKYLGGKIEEIPVTYRKRVRGVGHVNLSSAWEVFSNIIRWRIHYRELVVNGVSRARSQ